MGVLPSLRRALVDWLVRHRSVGHVEVPLPLVLSRSTPSVECWTVGEVVRALWDDASPAPASVTALLGLPPGTSFRRVARLLHEAHEAWAPASWADVAWRLSCGARPDGGEDPDAAPTRLAS